MGNKESTANDVGKSQWSSTSGFAGHFCPGVNKKIRRLGLEPILFQAPWNDVNCKDVFPNDKSGFKSLFGVIFPQHSDIDSCEWYPPPLPTSPHYTLSKRKK